MVKWPWVICVAMISVLNANSQKQFSKYKSVEVYEVRPGVLMTPRYASDGQVCEIGLEKLLYLPDGSFGIPFFTNKEIDDLIDELAPASERGKPVGPFQGLAFFFGAGAAFIRDYENVEVDWSERISGSDEHGAPILEQPTVLTIKWKHRQCK